MSLKSTISLVTEWLDRNVTESLNWVLGIGTLIHVVLSRSLKAAEFWENVLLISAIVANLILLWLRSVRQKNKDLNLFRTLVLNRLLPPLKSGQELLIDTHVGIVEDNANQDFIQKLKHTFREPATDNYEPSLMLQPVSCEAIQSSESQQRDDKPAKDDDSDKEHREEKSTKDHCEDLENRLSKNEAVVVVRSEQLDAKEWVYDSINRWANKNSDIPILFIWPRKRNEYRSAKHADNFRWIKDKPTSLPWGLLIRAMDRASAWRTQASYNRAIVANVIFLSILLSNFFLLRYKASAAQSGAIVQGMANEYRASVKTLTDGLAERAEKEKNTAIKKLVSEYAVAIHGMHDALSTKLDFEREILGRYDDKLQVSYFIHHESEAWPKDKAFVFVTTETARTKNKWPEDASSLIGCGFANRNEMVEYDNTGTRVYGFENLSPVPNHQCVKAPRAEPIKSIVCSAYTPSEYKDKDNRGTVGICIFSGSDESILTGGYLEFLSKRTTDFSNRFDDLIKNQSATVLAERLCWEDYAKGTPPDEDCSKLISQTPQKKTDKR